MSDCTARMVGVICRHITSRKAVYFLFPHKKLSDQHGGFVASHHQRLRDTAVYKLAGNALCDQSDIFTQDKTT